MPFRFPLAAVLLVREYAELREERALQKIQHEIAQVSRQIEQLDAEIAGVQVARNQILLEPIAAFQLHSILLRAEDAAKWKKPLLERLRVLLEDRNRQMMVYQAARRDHETLTDMLEKQRESYEQEQTRKAQKLLDDIYVARRQRN
jgi:flagellar export protein FliJ